MTNEKQNKFQNVTLSKKKSELNASEKIFNKLTLAFATDRQKIHGQTTHTKNAHKIIH